MNYKPFIYKIISNCKLPEIEKKGGLLGVKMGGDYLWKNFCLAINKNNLKVESYK
jgi:hypothetical protein